MKIAKTSTELANLLPETGIGFVPTMGALHDGHLSLVAESVSQGLFTVTSIFINPTQFNNQRDFEQYPVDIAADCEMLEKVGCDVVFLPRVKDIYPSDSPDQKYLHQFGELESRYEGEFRPGHFRGVAQVVHILFEMVRPSVAFFGEKDFQQLAIIRALTKRIDPKPAIVSVQTMRESDGLAMSSRNRRLNPEQRKAASLLHRALSFAKANRHQSSSEIIQQVRDWFEEDGVMKLEYFDIVDELTFTPIDRPADSSGPRALIAAYAGEVRLIDNMSLSQ